MVDPATAYQIAVTGYKIGKFAYREADKRVKQFASQEGITKAEAWALVRQEAARRSDTAMMEVADFAESHPVTAKALAALVPGGQLMVSVARARRRAKLRGRRVDVDPSEQSN
jgi:hypothetical protein